MESIKDKPLMEDKKQKQRPKRLYILMLTFALLSLAGAGTSFQVYQSYQSYSALYHKDLSLAEMGMQHVQTGETLLKALPKNPFDIQGVNQAQHEFTTAMTAFVQVDRDLE